MSLRSALSLALAAAACETVNVPLDAGQDATALPNLRAVVRLPIVQERTFSATSCEVAEGCTVAGRRRLLRFQLDTPNVGPGDLVVGDPVQDGAARPEFEFGLCHGHYHLRGYADYRLLTMDGREVGRGHKQGFCLEDTDHAPDVPVRLVADRDRFTCARQGIHAGWMDTYARTLDCQYVDVTDVPPGRYRIRAEVNFERRLREARYDDNVGELVVDLAPPDPDAGVAPDAPPDAPPVDPTLPCPTAEQGLHRDCGWQAEPAPRRCTPGARVLLGCDPRCAPPLGHCEGDPVLRVCAGERPCADLDALATGDDSCAGDGGANPCARTSFTCPASGVVRVLTAAYRAGTAYACRVAAM